MFFFPVYAVCVWLIAFRFRRNWRGLLVVAAGIAGLMAIAWAHYRLSIVTDGRVYLPILQMLMYPYIGLVALGGAFAVCMPRRPGPGQCHACGYHLKGLEPDGAGYTCPECGSGPRPADLPKELSPSLIGPRASHSRRSPADDAVQHAPDQDEQGHTRDQQQPQRQQPA